MSTQAVSIAEGSLAAATPTLIGPLSSNFIDSTTLAEKFAEQNKKTWDNFQVLDIVHPVGRVYWVHIDRVQANDWNPNSVANEEMRLLHTSISEDGYTMPIVTIWDPTAGTTPDTPGRFVIVDGFHRYTTMRRFSDIYETTGGFLPLVVLDKPVADRIASTVRHNRARGKHSVGGMGNLVFQMLEEGVNDVEICEKLGLDAEELARLKHVTGYSKLYADRTDFSAAVLTGSQMKAKRDWKQEHPDESVPQF